MHFRHSRHLLSHTEQPLFVLYNRNSLVVYPRIKLQYTHHLPPLPSFIFGRKTTGPTNHSDAACPKASGRERRPTAVAIVLVASTWLKHSEHSNRLPRAHHATDFPTWPRNHQRPRRAKTEATRPPPRVPPRARVTPSALGTCCSRSKDWICSSKVHDSALWFLPPQLADQVPLTIAVAQMAKQTPRVPPSRAGRVEEFAHQVRISRLLPTALRAVCLPELY